MNAAHLVDALSTSLFALVGIWAAVVRRHWFLRFAAVGAVLALALLIPAYEVVIEFAVQMAVIAVGVALWRGGRFRPRLSLETALLAMVVAAVIAAVLGAAPAFSWNRWAELVFLGVFLGAMSLLCLWIACGRSPLGVRALGAVAGVAVWTLLFHLGASLSAAVNMAKQGGDWRAWFGRNYQLEDVASWLGWFGPTIALGVTLMSIVLTLARLSGWFTDKASREREDSRPWVRGAARASLTLAFAAVVAPNLFLLYKLCTPPPRPTQAIPSDNGYDNFLAAGSEAQNRFGLTYGQDYSAWSDEQLQRVARELQPALGRIETGLAKHCWVTNVFAGDEQAGIDQALLGNTVGVIDVRLAQLRRADAWKDYVDVCCRRIQFGHESSRGQRSNYSLDGYLLWISAANLRSVLGALTAEECRSLANRLIELEQLREPFRLKFVRQLVFEQRQSWESHLGYLIQQWNGARQSAVEDAERQNAGYGPAAIQVLIADAALQAYWLDHGTAPETLDELVPTYLPAVPCDPSRDEPLIYRRRGDGYCVYAVGMDGEDNGGLTIVPPGQWTDADVAAYGPHLPPVPYRVGLAAESAAIRAWNWLGAAAAAAREAARPTAARVPR